jgi:dienelactone hydrolase
MIGTYGHWAAGLTRRGLPAFSFRRKQFTNVRRWRALARKRLLGRLAAPPPARAGKVQLVQETEYDGLHVELLRWQLPYGPPTEAVLLKPLGAKGRLPGVLGLHCHGGKKYWGRQKIARWGPPHPLMVEHQEQYYGGRAWANELARRGYVVLVPDAFAFASRMVLPVDCPPSVAAGAAPPNDDDHASIAAYNAWAAGHEHLMAKSLFSAGTTWPGVFWNEDRAALDVLAGRKDVDPSRLGCGGLSGGGLRTCLLAGLDDRIRAAVCVGFMTTWRDLVLHKCFTHTWMVYVPLLPGELDFPEILALRVPLPAMVMNCTEDQLFSLDEVRRSEKMLKAIYRKAGASGRFDFRYYPGGHKFDAPMQADAFAFFDRWLKG